MGVKFGMDEGPSVLSSTPNFTPLIGKINYSKHMHKVKQLYNIEVK